MAGLWTLDMKLAKLDTTSSNILFKLVEPIYGHGFTAKNIIYAWMNRVSGESAGPFGCIAGPLGLRFEMGLDILLRRKLRLYINRESDVYRWKQARSTSMYYPNPLLLPPPLWCSYSLWRGQLETSRTTKAGVREGTWDNRLIYFFLAFDWHISSLYIERLNWCLSTIRSYLYP